MKNMKNLFIKAHRLTKEIKSEFKGVDYKAQLGICIKFFRTTSNGMSAFVGAIGQLFQNVKMNVEKVISFANGSYGYTLKDEQGNLYKWLNKFEIREKSIIFKRFVIKRHVTQNGIYYNSIGKCLI